MWCDSCSAPSRQASSLASFCISPTGYPSVRRGQVIAIFMSATTIISVIAGPLCGATLKYFDGVYGLAGWQWLFIVQGLPAAVLGVVIYLYLQDGPADAQWLSHSEKDLLNHNLTHDSKDIA